MSFKRVSYESVLQDFPRKVSHKSVSYKSVLQECPGKECLTRVSNNVWPIVALVGVPHVQSRLMHAPYTTPDCAGFVKVGLRVGV